MNINVNRIMTLHALTFLHPGTGQNTGAVDLPVQRERHTGYPMIQSSGLKGSLRDKAERSKDEGKANPELISVFGSADNNEIAGALAVTDARILAFPMRSLQQVFVWVTCPMVLQRLARDISLIGLHAADRPQGASALHQLVDGLSLSAPLGFGEAIFPADSGFVSPLIVEEHRLKVCETPEASAFAGKVATAFQALCPNLYTKRLVIVSNEDFQFFVRHATQVSARIALNDRKTTSGDGGNLWYEETLPPETVLYALLLANKPRTGAEDAVLADAAAVMNWVEELFPKDKSYLQIGGNETVGQGWCQVNFSGDTP